MATGTIWDMTECHLIKGHFSSARQVTGSDEESGTPSDHRSAGHRASHRNGTLRLVTPSILVTIEPTK